MINKKPRILYISSANFSEGPGLIGWNHVSGLKQLGCEVDVLTLYYQEQHPDFLFIKKKRDETKKKLISIVNKLRGRCLPSAPHYFFYRKEDSPPVSVKKVLQRITKPYDLVVIYFWQEMLSFQTVDAIYEKLNHPVVFFICPDYSHMSGGCHFTCDCLRYQTGCGCCPAISSNNENDFTHWNVIFRKKIYDKINPVIFGNSYMNSFYRKSFLLKDANIFVYSQLFDTVRFRPIEASFARDKFKIPQSKTFIIAFGCQELLNPRKGISYLIKSLELFYLRLTEAERAKVLLLVAGRDFEKIKDKMLFPSLGIGMIPVGRLPEFYSAASIFICPSIDDAGPSMVSQSISCGTPVVGFKMGAMLDCVQEQGTGYCANLKDSEDLTNGVESFFRMSDVEYDKIRSHCVQFAKAHSETGNNLEYWIKLYENYLSEHSI